MAYTLKHQKVHWEVDLEARVLIGRTQLEIEVTGDELVTELRLNCRQCKVCSLECRARCTANLVTRTSLACVVRHVHASALILSIVVR